MAFRIALTQDTTASPETIFDVLTEPTQRSAWRYGVREIRCLDDGPLREGGRWLETGRSRKAGLDETNEFTCTVADRPRRVVMIMNGPPKGPPGGAFHWDFRLEPHGTGTRISVEFSSNTTGLLGLLIGLGQNAFALQVREDLSDLVKHVERLQSGGRK